MVNEERIKRLRRQVQLPLLKSDDQRLNDAGDGAPLREDHDVDPGADEEEGAGEEHEEGGDGEADGPVDAGLDVHDDGERDHHREREGEVVPVEEAVDAPLARLRVRVELVRPERQVARPDPARPDHQEHKRREKERQLSHRSLHARAAAPTFRRVQARERRCHCQDQHALSMVNLSH